MAYIIYIMLAIFCYNKIVEKLKKFIASIVICLGAGFFGSIVTTPSINTWYAELNKPFFNPPNWIFGPVWTTLYLLMALSLYLVWIKKTKENKRLAIIVFFWQLTLNFFWSFLFFFLRWPAGALAEIVVFLVMIILTFVLFRPISKLAAYLLIPYIAWVCFASILNLFIVLLN
jgi:tryptophan-rich sensory protein